MAFRLASSSFHEGETIPKTYTDDGADRSPPLSWTNPPDGTASFALICDDPDAPRGTWVHWVLFNVPGEVRALAEHCPAESPLPNGARQGTNSFGELGYRGPAPPPGKRHRYYFTLFALDQKVDLTSGATKDRLLAAMQGHVLAETQLMATYQR
jgi:Raf kinase inhibitor-like YbhB/YbcL family protein